MTDDGRRSPKIEKLHEGVQFDTPTFLARIDQDLPRKAPIIVMWVNNDGSVEFRSNLCLRRDWAWMAAHLTAWSTDPPVEPQK